MVIGTIEKIEKEGMNVTVLAVEVDLRNLME
jgi:hypothetical protein